MIHKQYELLMSISKMLSANDTGETGAHQGGMLIPKTSDVLSFFPSLNNETKNPRVKLKFSDESNKVWDFMFIYYNNKFFGGTRNEFRLTGMTAFIKQNSLKAGDKIILSREEDGSRFIAIEIIEQTDLMDILKIGSSWKVVKI